ncbi:MAG TPA: hypothetical protein VMI31_09750, partial [Fimbriimonadaceae bacterium]|nr:hypothetical protein [Fimbriimonadaceae bacterium]
MRLRSIRAGAVVMGIGLMVAIAAAPSTASAEPVWGAPVTLGSTEREGGAPVVAVAPDGEAVAAWQGRKPAGIYVSSRAPGGRWSPHLALAQTRGEVEGPQIAVVARKTVVIWTETIHTRFGEARVVMAATRMRGKRWGRPRNISKEKRYRWESEGSEPQVTLTRGGKAIAIWQGSDEGHLATPFIKTVTQGVAGTRWTAPVGIRGSYEGQAPQVKATPGGEAVAIWGASYNEESGIDTSSRPKRGPWKTAGRLGFPGPFPAPELAMTPKGEAIAAWTKEPEDSYGSTIQVATRPPGGKWKVKTLDPQGYGTHPQIVVEPGGKATVFWVENVTFDEAVVAASTHVAGGGWSEPVNLADEGSPIPAEWDARWAVTGDGESIAVWAAGSSFGEGTKILASSRPRGQGWSKPMGLFASPRAPAGGEAELDLALATSGEATLVWRCFDGKEWVA